METRDPRRKSEELEWLRGRYNECSEKLHQYKAQVELLTEHVAFLGRWIRDLDEGA